MGLEWLLGISLAGLAAAAGSLGKVLLKKSYTYSSKMIFAVGIACLIVLNPVFSVLAYRFAAQSILSPMAGTGVVFNTVFTYLILNEQIRFSDIVAVLEIVVGAAMVGIAGSHVTLDIDMEELETYFVRASFIVYLCLLLPISLLLCLVARPAFSPKLPSSGYSLGAIFAVAALGGIATAQFYFLKSFMVIIHDGVAIFASVLPYVLILGALLSAVSGLFLLNIALKKYSAFAVLSIYEGTVIMVGAISGMALFHEMEGLSLWHHIIYLLGLAFVLLGVATVSRGPERVAATAGEQGMVYEAILDGEEPLFALEYKKELFGRSADLTDGAGVSIPLAGPQQAPGKIQLAAGGPAVRGDKAGRAGISTIHYTPSSFMDQGSYNTKGSYNKSKKDGVNNA